MPTTIERGGEALAGGDDGFNATSGEQTTEPVQQWTEKGEALGFFRFVAMKLLGEGPQPSPAMSEHFHHATQLRDPAPQFKNERSGHLG